MAEVLAYGWPCITDETWHKSKENMRRVLLPSHHMRSFAGWATPILDWHAVMVFIPWAGLCCAVAQHCVNESEGLWLVLNFYHCDEKAHTVCSSQHTVSSIAGKCTACHYHHSGLFQNWLGWNAACISYKSCNSAATHNEAYDHIGVRTCTLTSYT